MTLALTITMTAVGLDRFTAAQLGDGIDLQISSVGLTDAEFIIAPTLDALPGEFRRVQTISGEVIGSNTVHMMIRDIEPLTYTVRGLGLFLADGTLFAVYGQAEPIFEKSALTTLLLALDITFPTAAIDALSFGDTNFLNPPATEATPGVARIANDAIVDAGVDDARFVTAKKLARRLTSFVTLAMRGVANGVASLAADGKVPPDQSRVYQVNGHLGDVVLTAADVGAPKLSTTIVANGILKGGGSLDESREIRLDAATAAQIRAGTPTEGVAITPAGLAAAGVINVGGDLGTTWRRIGYDGFVDMGGLAVKPSVEGQFTLQFPWEFPNACLGVVATVLNTNQTVEGLTTMQEVELRKDRAIVFAQNHQSASNEVGGIRWRAWGY